MKVLASEWDLAKDAQDRYVPASRRETWKSMWEEYEGWGPGWVGGWGWGVRRERGKLERRWCGIYEDGEAARRRNKKS